MHSTSTLRSHCEGSRGKPLLHLTHRPPNCTKLVKHPSQKVHLHSAPTGVTGALKSWHHTMRQCPYFCTRKTSKLRACASPDFNEAISC